MQAITYFKKNLKHLRAQHNISQAALAAAIGISRARIAALESGYTKSAQVEDYIKIAKYFNVTVEQLLCQNLSQTNELQSSNSPSANAYKASRILQIVTDRDNEERIVYVPIHAKAGYTTGFKDARYIATLPSFDLPFIPRHGSYRTFPISGDSMLPIPDGAYVTASYVEDWTSIKAHTPCIVVMLEDEDIVFKNVSILPNDMLLLTSTNPAYEPYTVSLTAVAEIWQFYMYHSTAFPQENNGILDVHQKLDQILFHLNTQAL